MRIYLSSRFGRQEELRGYASALEDLGHTITSSWLQAGVRDLPEYSVDESAARRCAVADANDILRSHCLIAFTESPEPRLGGQRGGRHVEFGVGLVMSLLHDTNMHGAGWNFPPMRLVVVGYRENVFHAMPGVQFFPTWAACLEALR